MTSPIGTSRLDKLAFIVFEITLFLTPIFFIPSGNVPILVGKSALILYGATIAFVLWLIARLKDGVFTAPRTAICAATGVFAAAYALAAIFSPSPLASLAGQSFDIGSLSFILPTIVLACLATLLARSKERIFYSYAALLGSLLIAGLFQIVRVFAGPGALSFGVLTSATSNLIGSWSDVAVFFGLGALVSFVTLDRSAVTGVARWLAYAALAVSLFMLVVVGYAPVWIALASFSLVYFIYELSMGKGSGTVGSRLPYHALAILVIAVIFAFFGQGIESVIAQSLGTGQVEVRPSWSATLDVTRAAIKDHPILGAGPNRFSAEWDLHKPSGINGTLLWNVDFNYGIGLVSSFGVTTGILGLLAALLFLAAYLKEAAKALFRSGASPFSRYLVLSSLFGSAYLWVFAIVYVPSPAIWTLTLAMTGLFVASLREDGAIGESIVSVEGKPASSFVSVLLSVLLLIAAIAFGYFVTVRLMANIAYNQGVAVINASSDLNAGEAYIARAATLAPSDAYYQSLSEIYLVRLNQLVADANANKISKADAQAKLQSLVGSAITYAQDAVSADPSNYQNYLTLGRAYEAVVPLGVQGSYDRAKSAYGSALALDPEAPDIYLVLARLEVANNDDKAAEAYIADSLKLKPDYADAIYLLAQIQIAQNDIPNAIKSESAVATLSPSDPGVFFQLGLLYYNEKDYQNATLALERAVSLSPEYANAQYFLGLSYYLTGQKDKSLAEFEALLKTNPDSQVVKDAIANLQAGKSPVPAPSRAASTSTLPVKQ